MNYKTKHNRKLKRNKLQFRSSRSKQFRILIIIIPFLFIGCNGSAQKIEEYKISSNDITSFLKNEDIIKIKNQKEAQIRNGCIITITTQGALELEKILDDSTYFKSVNDRKLFCISVIENRTLYHLHDIVGNHLSTLLKNDDKVDFIINNTNSSSLDYCLMRTNHTIESVIIPGGYFLEPTLEVLTELMNRLCDNRLSISSKLYIMDGIYSLIFKQKTIKNIYSKISSLNIEKELLLYNDSLYNNCFKLKLQFEQLDKIHTWMEMDKNYKNIKTMLLNYQPTMFFQILCFNPSTVLDSKELCKLKETALISIIKNAKDNSFYDDMKYVYLNELLIDGNYIVRFLDGVMKRDSIPKYKLQIEKEY